MEIIFIVLLIILNGLFALSEIAILSARKSKLQELADGGNLNAIAALKLSTDQNRFLSTIQIGITFIGVFAGAFGGGALAHPFAKVLTGIPILSMYAENIALIVIVSLITYFSLVIGELVPKRIALGNAERIALIVARPMHLLSTLFSPLVSILSMSVDHVLSLLRIKAVSQIPITEEEVNLLIQEGEKSGTFNMEERTIVERTFRLSDRKANSLMIPRKEIQWFTLNDSVHEIKKVIKKTPYSYFPVCHKDLDSVAGIIRTEELLTNYLDNEKIDIQLFLHKPLFLPETTDGLRILELFKKTGMHAGLVVDEYGNVQGLVSLTDILEAIVGDIPSEQDRNDPPIAPRDNNTFLVDGLLSIDEFKEYFKVKKLSEEKAGLFQTIGGYIIHTSRKIPVTGDLLEHDGFRFEVVDMDGNRVDKILVSKQH